MAGAKPGVHVLQLKPINVPKALQDGEKFVKWDEDNSSASGTPCTLKVDSNGFFIYWTYWTDQHETDMLDISTISDTRFGRAAKIPKDPKLKEQVNIGHHETPLEQKTLTICHNYASFVDVSFINFVHQKPETVKYWADELLKVAYNLLAVNASPMQFLKKTYTRLCISKDKNGKIPVKQIYKVFARHGEDKKKVESALDSCKLPNSKTDFISPDDFTWEKFIIFYGKLTNRIEVDRVFCELTNQQLIPDQRLRSMSIAQLVSFLNEYQRDPRLNEILYPYADASKAAEVIAQYEPSKENIAKGELSIEGFLNYLMSDDNNVLSLDKLDIHHDMEQPLSHYFINSSHNTYLTGHQFRGKSSVEMYRQCLLAGCRCVELDFWDGKDKNEEPVIVHGFTFVSEISAKEVIEAIAGSAFKTSEFPVILSFENHCNPRQQAKIAQYCREYFGEMLLDSPLENHPLESSVALPSPTDLKRRIIIKNKKKINKSHKKSHATAQVSAGESQFHVDLSQSDSNAPAENCTRPEIQGNGDIIRPPLEKDSSRDSFQDEGDIGNGDIADGGADDEDSPYSDEEDEASTEDRKSRQDKERVAEVEAGAEISALVNYVQPVHFVSFEVSEKKNRSYEMSSLSETQALSLLKTHPTEFVNYNKRQLSRVYPRGKRVDSSNFLPHQFWNAGCQLVALNYQSTDLPMQLNLGIFEYNNRSGYLLKPDFMRRPDKRFDPFAESTVDGIIAGTFSIKIIAGQFLSEKRISCYVEVEMYGLPTDTYRKRFRTKTISNNAINPIWDEEPFIFKKVVLPEIATIRIAAYEESNKVLLGHRVLPFVGLIPGYKHIVLRGETSHALGLPTVFVHIKVGDYVPDKLSDFAEALANPIKYMNKIEKRSHQLEVFQDDEEASEADKEEVGTPLTATVSQNSQTGAENLVQKVDSTTGSQKPETPPAKRQNSINMKPVISTKSSEDRTTTEAQPFGLETFEIQAEELEKLWDQKIVKEKKKKIDKELKDIEGKLEKKRQNLLQELEKKKKDLEKSHSKLVKKISTQKSTTSKVFRPRSKSLILKPSRSHISNYCFESCTSKENQEEEHKIRLEDLEKVYKESLLRLHQEQLLCQRKIQEDNHEPLYNTLEKSLKGSQQTQLKMLQSVYDSTVEDIKKKQTEYHREQMKLLSKNTADKQELERKKREVRNELVMKGTQDRQKLISIHDRKKEELEKEHEAVWLTFEQEKSKAYQSIQANYEEKLAKIRTASLDSL